MQDNKLQTINRAGNRLLVILAISVVAVAQALAVDPDLTAVTAAAGTQFSTFLTTNAPGLIMITLLATGFRFVMKMLKRGIH